MNGYYYESRSLDPFVNLAIESYMLDFCREKKSAVLFLWKNSNTVVIGRNQDAFSEVNMDYAEQHGTKIVRRITGGGAVYHDENNLNFSIILPRSLYDIEKTMDIIVKSLKDIGIDAERDGRNDICCQGCKVSGNAYYSDEYVGMHHGTLLFVVNYEAMDKLLNVDPRKLAKHRIRSVRSRVAGLKDFCERIDVGEYKKRLIKLFFDEFGVNELDELQVDSNMYFDYYDKYSSRTWTFAPVAFSSDEL